MGSAFMSNINSGRSAEGSKKSPDGVLRWIGDLDHPFYSDERSRFVWYEASAIGFQLLFAGIYFMVGVMFWIGGAGALPYGLPFLLLAVVSAGVIQNVATSNSAEYYPNKTDFSRSRGKAVLVLGLFVLGGALRAMADLTGESDGGFWGGFGEGGTIGLGVGALAGVAALAVKGRQHRRKEELDSLREE